MNDQTENEAPAAVKPRTRTQRICAKCAAGWGTTYKLNGVQIFECRRHAPESADRPGVRMYWRTTLASEGCHEWVAR